MKQADVILLGYPLLRDMPDSVREKDLTIYEKVRILYTIIIVVIIIIPHKLYSVINYTLS